MEAAICSIEVEVSSAAWAWPCAPWMMSLALAEICPAEEATCTEASWMLSTMRRRLTTMSLRLFPRVASSSSLPTVMLSVRSPLVTAWETSTMCWMGRNQRPITYQPPRAPRATRKTPRSEVSTKRRRCWAFISLLLIATAISKTS